MGRTAGPKLLLGALAAVLGCGAPSEPGVANPRIDFVDGAIEPVLVRGDSVAIAGFGFGSAPGTLRFGRVGGGTQTVTPDSAAWTDQVVRAVVPDSAVSGTLTLTTAGNRSLTATVHVLPNATFDPAALAWQSRTAFPTAPVGVALTAATFPSGSGVSVSLYAAGGAEPLGGDSAFVPDSGVYVAHAAPGGVIGGWTRSIDFPAARAFAAVVVATRYNSRFAGTRVYVIGGIDATGRAQATVFFAKADANGVDSTFTPIEPLPAPIAGALAVVRRGRIYVMGGADTLGHPQRAVYVGRIGLDGHIDGWYQEPVLPAPRAYGGAVVRDGRVYAFGGVADSVPPGAGLDAAPTRLATADTAALSIASGFFAGVWSGAGTFLPEGRSQFATLDLGNVVLAVGGYYPSVTGTPTELLAAGAGTDTLGAFAAATATNTIAGQGGGTLVGPTGVTWRDADGTPHGLVLGGFDLATRLRRASAWGF